MQQSERRTTGQKATEIALGDVVRLLQPFRPERYCLRQYNFGVVAGVIADGCPPGLGELVIYLYDLDSATKYIDEFGIEALFSFASHEVEICNNSK